MKHEDLSPKEQAALDRLRDNAPDAPDALASLDDAGRARVLEAFSSTEAHEATDGPAGEATEAPALSASRGTCSCWTSHPLCTRGRTTHPSILPHTAK